MRRIRCCLICTMMIGLLVSMSNASSIDEARIVAAWLFDEGEGPDCRSTKARSKPELDSPGPRTGNPMMRSTT